MHSFKSVAADEAAFVGKIEYLHNGFRTPSCAFEINENGAVLLSVPRKLGTDSVYIELLDESMTTVCFADELSWFGIHNGLEEFIYEPSFDLFGVGLFFFRISVSVSGVRYFVRKKDSGDVLLCDEENATFFQLSVSDFVYEYPKDKTGGIIYHIFVDRFRRGRVDYVKPGAVLVDNWRGGIPEYPAYPGAPLKNNCFYGGTLYGIVEKLDYIAGLGVNTIYLSPIFDAASNHKYDTADYMTVDEMFGGEEALKLLISEAKERNIGIILDGVFNHTGADSKYFNRYGNYPDVGAYQSKKSPYYSWFDFKEYPDKYTCWWGIEILPRIHPDVDECGRYISGVGGVIEKYSALGVEGFRLDVVDELSDEFIASIKHRLNESNKRSVLYGEVWEDGSNKIAYGKRKRYYLGCELDGVMNYPIRKGIIDYLTGRGTDTLHYALTDIINNAPRRIANLQMNLLGTHDTIRIATALGGESPEGRSNDYLCKKQMTDLERGKAKRRLRMAYTVLATIPGIPSIFYGDETALEGYGDPFNRMPYPWGNEDFKLISFFKKIGRIRREHSVYKEGSFKLLSLTSDLLVFSRRDGEHSYLTVVNNSGSRLSVEFSSMASALISDPEDRKSNFELEPFSAEIFATRCGTEFECVR